MNKTTKERLQELFRSDPIPLLEALVLQAEDEDPSWSVEEGLSLFQQLCTKLVIPQGEDITRSIARLNIHFSTTLGFIGDEKEYGHPHNSILHQVIARKKGLPIILSCLYVLIGQSHGLPIVPISFPGHFLVGVQEPQFFIDPFHGCRILKTEQLKASLKRLPEMPNMAFEELIQPASNRQILVRINNNLIRAHQRLSSPKGMLRAIDRNLLLAPEHTAAHHARYILLKGMGEPIEAANALERYLQYHPDHPKAHELTQELSNLRGIH